MTYNFFLPKIQELDLHDMWFQQDGAKWHTTRVTMDCEASSVNILYHVRDQSIGRLDRAILDYGAMLELMAIQTSSLELTHWKTTLKHLFLRYRPKCWKEYAKIGLKGWTIQLHGPYYRFK